MKPSNIIQYGLYCVILYHVCANPNTQSTNIYQVNNSAQSVSSIDSMSMSMLMFDRQYHKGENDDGSMSDIQNTNRLQSVNHNPLQVLYNHTSPSQSLQALISQSLKSQLATFEPLNVSDQVESIINATTNKSNRRVQLAFNFSWVDTEKPKFHAKNECYIDNEALIPHFDSLFAQKILFTYVAEDIGENGMPKYVLEIDLQAMRSGFPATNAELIYKNATLIMREIASLTLDVISASKRLDDAALNNINNGNSIRNSNVYIDRRAMHVSQLQFKPCIEYYRIKLNLFAKQIESWKHLMIVYYWHTARYRFNVNATKYGCNEGTLSQHVRLLHISQAYTQHSIVKTNIYSDDISRFALRFQLDCVNYILRYLFVNAMKKSKQYELRVKQILMQYAEYEHPFGVERLKVTNQSWIDHDSSTSTSIRLKQECYDHFLSTEYQTKLEKYRIWIEKVYNHSGFSQNLTLISNNVSIWNGVPNTIPKWMSIIINIDNIYQNKSACVYDTSTRPNVRQSRRRQAKKNDTRSKAQCGCLVM